MPLHVILGFACLIFGVGGLGALFAVATSVEWDDRPRAPRWEQR